MRRLAVTYCIRVAKNRTDRFIGDLRPQTPYIQVIPDCAEELRKKTTGTGRGVLGKV